MSPRETILYVPIDFVGSDERSSCFSTKHIQTLLEARQKVSDLKLPIRLALKTTAIAKDQHKKGMSKLGLMNFNSGIAKLSKEGIDSFVEFWPSGPTRSMYGVLFDQGAIAIGFRSICTSDLDATPPQNNLEKFIELNDKVETNGSILGIGSRNTQVILSYNPENNYLRKIFEGIMNLTANKKINIHLSDKNIIDKAYKEHGDMITGTYLFNPNVNKSLNFANFLVESSRRYGFFWFEDEYFMVIAAGNKGGISGITFNSAENFFDKIDSKKEKNEIINNHIKKSLEMLAKTNVKDLIITTINIEYDGKGILRKYYTKEQINEVCNYMKETLTI